MPHAKERNHKRSRSFESFRDGITFPYCKKSGQLEVGSCKRKVEDEEGQRL